MKTDFSLIIFHAACLFMVSAMFLLPPFSFPGYSFLSNTLSDLGARFTPNAWIMNASFVLFGTGIIAGGWRSFRNFPFQRLLLFLFGISIIMLAIFNHAPLLKSPDINITEEGWHLYFLSTSLLSFVILSVSTGLFMDDPEIKSLSVGAGLSEILFAVLFIKDQAHKGIWQRILFLTAIAWMTYFFRKHRKARN
jgi:hypothetical membrane protein